MGQIIIIASLSFRREIRGALVYAPLILLTAVAHPLSVQAQSQQSAPKWAREQFEASTMPLRWQPCAVPDVSDLPIDNARHFGFGALGSEGLFSLLADSNHAWVNLPTTWDARFSACYFTACPLSPTNAGARNSSFAARDECTLLGERAVTDRANQDTLVVTAACSDVAGSNSTSSAPIQFHRVVVHYANGGDDTLEPRDRIGVLDLRGGDRTIKNIDSWYDTKSVPRRDEIIRVSAPR